MAVECGILNRPWPGVKWPVAPGTGPLHLASMRIASLLASGTEIIYALGLGDRLVAVSHECDYPAEVGGKPRLTRPRFATEGLSSGQIDEALRMALREHGSAYTIDESGLLSCRPDLLLTQSVCEVCAVSAPGADRAAAMLDPVPAVLSLDAHRVSDIMDSIRQVGVAAGVEERAVELVTRLEDRIAAVADRVAGADRPTVLGLEWLDPVFVPGHWVPEMFDLAGGELLYGQPGERSRQMSWREIEGRDPDVLVIMPCGFNLEATVAEADSHAERLRRLAPRAVQAGKAFTVDGSAYFSRSGPRIATGIELLGAMLHPSRCGSYRMEGAAAPWPGEARASRNG